jgi:hypothetical protein
MGSVFGKEKPLKEVLRENKRMINKAIRELDREKVALEREEKRLTMDIKKAAKDQQMKAVKIMAKVGSTILYIYPYVFANATSSMGQLLRAVAYNALISYTLSIFFRTWFERDSTLPNLLKCEVICRVVP